MSGNLYYGDNLEILRTDIADASVDLVYLDPPFNSNATYNVLFQSPTGADSEAQIEAFEDTWHWSIEAEEAFDDVMQSGNTDAAELLRSMRSFLGENDVMAYLTMMAVRLIELHRVLKATGSIFLHCDPTASHYLKLLMDSIFGFSNYRNEIIWKRKAGRGETNKKAVRFGVSHDILLFYGKSKDANFERQYRPNNKSYIDSKFTHVDHAGRRYHLDNLTSPSLRPNLKYEYKGYQPPEKGWAVSFETMQRMESEGRLYFPADKNKRIRRKRFLDELEGETVDSLWDDISPINSQAQERLGYPTQKPVALLERVISCSSNTGDTILDPFCGCGTTIHAAEKLDREWIGIDITHLAISLIEKRLSDAFPTIEYYTHGTPKDLAGAQALADADKFQFEWWAISLVGAQPYGGKKKGADTGIDGIIYCRVAAKKVERVIVSVKGGKNVGVQMIRDLRAVIEREKSPVGIFICLAEPTSPMKAEAAKAGFYTDDNGQKYERLQIHTVETLLGGAKPHLPLVDTAAMFKQAAKEKKKSTQGALDL